MARLLVKKHYVGSTGVFACPSMRVIGVSHLPFSEVATWNLIRWFNVSYFYIVKLGVVNPVKGSSTGGVYMLMADRSNGASQAVTPNLDPTSAHGMDGRNVLYTDNHVDWINGASVTNQYTLIQQDWGDYTTDDASKSPQTLGQVDADLD